MHPYPEAVVFEIGRMKLGTGRAYPVAILYGRHRWINTSEQKWCQQFKTRLIC